MRAVGGGEIRFREAPCAACAFGDVVGWLGGIMGAIFLSAGVPVPSRVSFTI